MPKDGLAPLESIVDTSLLPCTVTIHWQFTYPPAHHPFGSRRAFRHDPAFSQSGRESLAVEVIRFEDDLEQGSFKMRASH